MTQDPERLAEIESCPSCGALPCDWCNNPHASTLKPSERGPTNDEIIAEAKRISDLEWEGNEEHADFFGPLLFRLQADTSWFKPVPEVDEATKVTRSVLHAHQRAMTPPDSGWGNMSYEKGSYDDLPAFQAARAVIAALEKSPRVDVPSIPGWLHDWAIDVKKRRRPLVSTDYVTDWICNAAEAEKALSQEPSHAD